MFAPDGWLDIFNQMMQRNLIVLLLSMARFTSSQKMNDERRILPAPAHRNSYIRVGNGPASESPQYCKIGNDAVSTLSEDHATMASETDQYCHTTHSSCVL
jgi:hypothetical protein